MMNTALDKDLNVSPITLDQFQEQNIESYLPHDSLDHDCHRYQSLFEAELKKCSESGNETKTRVLQLVVNLCSLRFQLDDKGEPLTNLWVWGDKRSAKVSDFTDAEVKLLAEAYPAIANPELRARLADVVWLRLRDRKAAAAAIEAYILSSELPRHFYLLSVERLRRAIQLCKSLNDESAFKRIVERLSEVLKQADDEFLIGDGYQAISMLNEERVGDPGLMSSLCERAARIEEAQGKGFSAHQWWLLHRDWVGASGAKEKERDSVLAAAENFVQMGIKDGAASGLIASASFEKAIELLRTISGTKERVAEIHVMLLDAQRRSLSEMKKHTSPPVDISSQVLKAQEAVRGQSFDEALRTLGTALSLPSAKNARTAAIEQIREHPLMHLVGGVVLSSKGKRVANKSTIVGDDEDGYEKAVYGIMLQHFSMTRELMTVSFIEPMRREIHNSHSVTPRMFLPLVTGNPFVPDGRRHIFAKGLYHGLIGDTFSAAHILIPQIENSLRHLLERSGEVVNLLDGELIQDEFPMNKILDHPKIAEALGSEDLVLVLKEFLVEKQSSNYRNGLCHGLLDDPYLHSTENLFGWWLVVFLCHRFEYVIPSDSEGQKDENKK